MRLRALVLALLSAAVLVGCGSAPASISAPLQAADADNKVYEAVEGLKQNNVFLFPGAEVGLEAELREALDSSSIGVVVLPRSASMASYDKLVDGQEASDGYEMETFVRAVYDTAPKNIRTVIVLSKNKYGVKANQSTESITELLLGTDADNVEKIILHRDKIQDWDQIVKGEWVPWLTVPVGLLMILGLALFSPEISRSWSRRQHAKRNERARRDADKAKKAEAKRQAKEAEAAAEQRAREDAMVRDLSRDIPRELRSKLNKVQNWAAQNVAEQDREFAQEIKLMVTRFETFFQRLDERGTPQQRRIAMTEYADMLNKISAALSDKYYLDILAHPDLWDDPEGRIAQVKRAVQGVQAQLLDNIKQVNASRDLDFKSSLEQLAGFMEAPKVEDLYKDK